jgi:hypothetical protein
MRAKGDIFRVLSVHFLAGKIPLDLAINVHRTWRSRIASTVSAGATTTHPQTMAIRSQGAPRQARTEAARATGSLNANRRQANLVDARLDRRRDLPPPLLLIDAPSKRIPERRHGRS